MLTYFRPNSSALRRTSVIETWIRASASFAGVEVLPTTAKNFTLPEELADLPFASGVPTVRKLDA